MKVIIRSAIPDRLLVILLMVLYQPFTLPGQAGSDDEEIIELSPFIVNPPQGWFARETLAGTRLKTPLVDLAQQIEVLTADFMEDFSLSTLEEASMYTLNLESMSEYFEGDGFQDNLKGNLRIRGLGEPSQSRMYFESEIPSDSYNIERIDIGSGPNPLLLGSGAPGGVLNIGLQSPLFENGGRLAIRCDSEGSYRFELHGNQVLVDDVLAVRASLLYDQQYWERNPSGELDRRVYAAATYKPFKKTLIRGYFEEINILSRRPNRMYPIDTITPWLFAAELPDSGEDVNRPIFYNNLDWLLEESFEGQVFAPAIEAPVYVIDNGNNGGYKDFVSWQHTARVRDLQDWEHVSPLNAETDGYTFIDDTYYPSNLNITGNLRHRELKGHSATVLLNQQVLEDLHVEFGYQRVKTQRFWQRGLEEMWAIHVDPNAYLPDNLTANPNLGKYYVEGSNWQYSRGWNYSNDMMANLAYEHDFADADSPWLRWLGRHSLVGGWSRRFEETRAGAFIYRIYPQMLDNGDLLFPDINYVDWYYPYYYDGNGNRIQTELEPRFMDQDNARIFFRYYLDPENGDFVPSLPLTIGEPIQLVDSAGNPFTVDPENTGFFDGEGRRLTVGGTGSNNWDKINVIQFAYQGYFLKDRLKVTYGLISTKINYARPVVDEEDPYTGLMPHFEDVPIGEWWEPAEGEADVKGVVLDPFRDWIEFPLEASLLFFGQRSNTFQDNTNTFNPFGEPISNAIGVSEDKGIILMLFKDRFVFRYNRYENSAGPDHAGSMPYQGIRGQLGRIEERVRQLDPGFPTIDGPYGLGFTTLGTNYPYLVVSDRKSVGHEIIAHWTVNEKVELMFNASIMDVTESNIGKDWWDWMDQRLEMYKSLDVPEGGTYDPEDVDGDGFIGRWTWETARFVNHRKESLAERWDRMVIHGQTGKEIIQALEGKSNPFIRNLRFNLNFKYRFTEGFLKGSSIGGAIRWREAPLLSYGSKELNGAEVIDLEEPLYGKEEYYLDLNIRYQMRGERWLNRHSSITLNIRNVFDRDDPIPVMFNVAGEPLQMAYTEGIRFILTFKMDLW